MRVASGLRPFPPGPLALTGALKQPVAMFHPMIETRLSHFAQRQSATQTEALLALYCDERGVVLGSDISEEGHSETVALPVRGLVARALRLRAENLVIAHSHPSGDPRPSARDVRETIRLERLLFPLDIALADHVIVAGQARFSFKAAGLI